MLPKLSMAGHLSQVSWQTVPQLQSPATAKLLSPKLVCIRVSMEEERICGRPCSETSRMSESMLLRPATGAQYTQS